MESNHIPVLIKEVVDYLHIKKQGRYIDATLGGGGHTRAICEQGARVLAMDWDKEALETARQHLLSCLPAQASPDVVFAHSNFAKITEVAKEHNFVPVDGVLFDLGISSTQLGSARGFSFTQSNLLDMRMNPQAQGVTAADLLNSLREDQLNELFSQTVPKNVAGTIARAIVRARELKKFEETRDLVAVIDRVQAGRKRSISPLALIFLALRIAVNRELENLKEGLKGAVEILGKRGRLVVISFHSGEDSIIKNFFKEQEAMDNLKILTKKPIRPSQAEIAANPRAKSAKLRIAERI
ncbi:16S rRNA (cytosine(1402)-N(4))-methyltransferase RsmH [Candidatus Microgenomates bacterium]|nr:16S rRNA (cytosine(1402)-N(4))-methyltransferase RsmH [Candidatus Microgenomates bacterium]